MNIVGYIYASLLAIKKSRTFDDPLTAGNLGERVKILLGKVVG